MARSDVTPVGLTKVAPIVSNKGSVFLLAVFMIALLIPVHPQIGGLRMDPYRILFIVIYIPIVLKLLSGGAGGVTTSDKLIFAYSIWVVLCFTVNHGFEHFAYSVVWVMEISGGYILGRLLVRNIADYQRFVRFHVIAIFIMAPLAFYELLTSHMVVTEFLGKFLPATQKNPADRFGLSRVQVVFPHSILFGLYCSIAVANIFYVAKDKLLRSLFAMAGVIAVTFTSLSSAPLLSILLQSGLIAYDKITKGRWKLLMVLAVIAYVIVASISNRSPLLIIIEKLTLDPQTGWYRIHIWRYGMQNVWQHPIFGIGFNDWVRPDWLSASVDNFWLLNAMRTGIPSFLLLAAAILIHSIRIVKVPLEDQMVKYIRTGYLIVLFGILFTLSTVHVWDALAVFIMFYIGAGAFLYTNANIGQTPIESGAAHLSPDAIEPNPETTAAGTKLARKPRTAKDFRLKVTRS